MIRVLIVEDSPLVAQMIKEILESDPQVGVLGIAKDGFEAIQLTKKLKPDVITMDIHMPRMDGFEATKQIMGYFPTPILILSSSVFKEGTEKAFLALSYGAVDVLEKNIYETDPANEEAGKALLAQVKLIARVRVIPHPLAKLEEHRKSAGAKLPILPNRSQTNKIVGLVASTGGPQILANLLKDFPENFPCPLLLVQHISAGFTEGLVEWLDHRSSLSVKLAKHHEEIEAGTVYVAPPGVHMGVTSHGKGDVSNILLTHEAVIDGQKPSGTFMLQSLAKAYGAKSLGVLLTGMGADGALGLKAIYEAEGHTITQDEKSCTVYGMPRIAVEMGVVHEVLSPDQIVDAIVKWVLK